MTETTPPRPIGHTTPSARPFVPLVAVRTVVSLPLRDDAYDTAAVDNSTAPRLFSFCGLEGGDEHVALVLGDALTGPTPLVRLHSECLTGDVFGSARCDCGPQLQESLSLMRHIGGILLYLRQEGRGIGLYNKLDAYGLQDQGLDTYAANRALDLDEDGRAYTVAAQMLQALEVWSCRLLTNNPDKVEQLVAHGIDVVERVSTGVYASAANYRYLAAKKQRALHAIDLPALEDLI